MVDNSSQAAFVATARAWGAIFWLLPLGLAFLFVGDLQIKTVAICCVGVASFLVGTLPIRKPGERAGPVQTAEGFSSPKIAMAFLALTIVLQLYFVFRSVTSLLDLGAEFRDSYYEGDVMGGNILFVLYESFIFPLGLYAISHWLCCRQRVAWWLFGSSTFLLLDALMKAGRFPLYFLLFFLALSRVIGATRIRIWTLLSAGLAVTVGALALVLARQGLDVYSNLITVSDLLRTGVVNYHIVGFYIFQQISSSVPFVDSVGGGAYTFGFFSYVVALIGRRAGFDIQYPQQDLNIALTNDSYIPALGTYNAFGTNLLPLYLDAGILGVILGFYILGFLASGRFNKRRKVDAMAVMALFVMIFGLFQPLIMGPYFAVPLVTALLQWVLKKRYAIVGAEHPAAL